MTRFRGPLEPDWLPFEVALDRILGGAVLMDSEPAATPAAEGRVLARAVTAPRTLPPWDNSSMDGFAVRAPDIRGASAEHPIKLRVVGEAFPGQPWSGRVEPGQAVRIMTGGPIPSGADSVVRVEDTDGAAAGDAVLVREDRDAGRHIRPAGEDMRAGDTVVAAGTVLSAGPMGVLRGLGVDRVQVFARPRVAILATGDELRSVDENAGGAAWEGGVPDTNSPTLAAAVRAAGGEPLPLGIARDNVASLREAIQTVREVRPDILITMGGASMGAADLVKEALDGAGFSLDFWRTRIRPGSPFSLGTLPLTPPDRDRIPVFGLPGNPVSSFVTFQLLVRPRILAASGQRHWFRPVVTAVAQDELTGAEDLAIFLRVRLEPAGGDPDENGSRHHYRARSTGPQGSGLLHSLATGEGLAVLPRGIGRVDPGDPVQVVLLGDTPGVPRVPLDRG